MRGAGLDERIAIEHLTTTKGDYGEIIESWEPLTVVWAKAIHQRGAESFAAAQTNAVRVVKFKMRFIDGIDATMRITWRGDQYDVFDVDESQRRSGELWVTATFNSGANT